MKNKGAALIDQLIFDIKENEWYCDQGDSESQMEDL